MEDLSKRVRESGIYGALEYACRSWHKHLIITDYQTADVVSALYDFLEGRFVLLLEVLSVLGAVGDAACALTMTAKWLNEVWPNLKLYISVLYAKPNSDPAYVHWCWQFT